MKSRHTVKLSKTSRQWFVLKTAVPSYKGVLNISWTYSFYLHVCFQLLWICNENFHIKLLTNFSYVTKRFPCCIGWKRSGARLYAVVSFFKLALVNCIHCCYKVPFVVIKGCDTGNFTRSSRRILIASRESPSVPAPATTIRPSNFERRLTSDLKSVIGEAFP